MNAVRKQIGKFFSLHILSVFRYFSLSHCNANKRKRLFDLSSALCLLPKTQEHSRMNRERNQVPGKTVPFFKSLTKNSLIMNMMVLLLTTNQRKPHFIFRAWRNVFDCVMLGWYLYLVMISWHVEKLNLRTTCAYFFCDLNDANESKFLCRSVVTFVDCGLILS